LRADVPSGRAQARGHELGVYHALVEGRIPFEMVHDRLLDEAHLASLKTLVLPDVVALSDAQCAQLRNFVERGGGLVATYETSLHDESGAPRKDFGLADLFGVRLGGGGDGDFDELPGLRSGEAAQDEAVKQGEDGRIRADAESQREDCGQ